jgi:peptide/nickel transport system substrate-binding protein
VIRHKVLALTGAGALAVALAACGSSNSSGSGDNTTSGTGSPWILGTTDTVTALDPAGSYDLGSSTLEYNLYQTLVTVPPNSTQIEGDAAKSCTYNNPKTLTCTLNPGEKFSNGDPLTSSDVKYSFERAIKIQDANGAAIYLLGSITTTAKDGTVTLNKGAIETPDDQTVVFHLDHPDTTFQYVLTYPARQRSWTRTSSPPTRSSPTTRSSARVPTS